MNLFWWTIPELQAECRKRGLSDSGNKRDLIDRLKGLVEGKGIEEPEALFEKFESYFDRKYAELMALVEKAEKGEVKILPYLPHRIENIPEYTVTPEQLGKYLSTVKEDKLFDVINTIKVSIVECIGDIIETYRYESTSEGKELENYIDSLLAVVKEHEKRLL